MFITKKIGNNITLRWKENNLYNLSDLWSVICMINYSTVVLILLP